MKSQIKRMTAILLAVYFLVSLTTAAGSAAKVTVYEHSNFEGISLEAYSDMPILGDQFGDKISSIKIESGTWRFYEYADYNGRYWDLGPGEYSWVENVGIPNDLISSFKQVPAITVYEHSNFAGVSFCLEDCVDMPTLGNQFGDKISSIKIESGTWRFYEYEDFEGRYWDLGPGEYSWVENVGIPNDLISSFRPI